VHCPLSLPLGRGRQGRPPTLLRATDRNTAQHRHGATPTGTQPAHLAARHPQEHRTTPTRHNTDRNTARPPCRAPPTGTPPPARCRTRAGSCPAPAWSPPRPAPGVHGVRGVRSQLQLQSQSQSQSESQLQSWSQPQSPGVGRAGCSRAAARQHNQRQRGHSVWGNAARAQRRSSWPCSSRPPACEQGGGWPGARRQGAPRARPACATKHQTPSSNFESKPLVCRAATAAWPRGEHQGHAAAHAEAGRHSLPRSQGCVAMRQAPGPRCSTEKPL